MLKSPLSQMSKQEDVMAWPALSQVQTKPWGSACCRHRMRLPGPRRKPETDQCKVSYGNHYVCLLQVAQNWLGLRGGTLFGVGCCALLLLLSASGSMAGGPSHQSLLGNLRKRRLLAFSVRGFPKTAKRSKPRPRNLSLPSKIPKKQKQKKQRSQTDGRHIWHLPRDWGHLPEIFGFFGFFGNPRRK